MFSATALLVIKILVVGYVLMIVEAILIAKK